MFEYDKTSFNAVEALEKFDLTPTLLDCLHNKITDFDDVREVMKRFPEIESAIEDLTSDELQEYLSKRYNVQFREEITYRMFGVPRKL